MDISWSNVDMKLSQYAKRVGISYKTGYRWWKAGTLDAYQTPAGTVVVRNKQEERQPSSRIALAGARANDERKR